MINSILCSLFLFDFDAKRKSGTEKEKHERLNGSSYQGQSPRTPNHVITRRNIVHSAQIIIRSDVVIPNSAHQCHPETLTRIWNVHSRSRTNSTLSQRERAKSVKNLLPYSLNALLPNKKKAAFTLAEVLITLGIIGIVAAMTIPTLISKNQKRVIEAKLKEDYSIVQQVIKSNEGDDVDMSMLLEDGNTNSQKQWFETYFAPYMKYSHVCYDQAGCWQKRGNNKNLVGSATPYNRKEIGIGLNVVTLKLNNGTNICLDVFRTTQELDQIFGITATERGLAFYIDTNGDSGPNVVGKDIYVLVYSPDNGIVPAGLHKTKEEINKNCSSAEKGQNAGYYCIMRVKNNGWEIPNDVWNIKV